MQFYFGGLGRCSLLLVLAAPAAALDVVCPDASIQEVACVEAGAVIDCDDATTVYLSYLALPLGSDAHPGVLYNHGGSGIQLGGDPAEAAGQLACAGYVGSGLPAPRPHAPGTDGLLARGPLGPASGRTPPHEFRGSRADGTCAGRGQLDTRWWR